MGTYPGHRIFSCLYLLFCKSSCLASIFATFFLFFDGCKSWQQYSNSARQFQRRVIDKILRLIYDTGQVRAQTITRPRSSMDRTAHS